MYSKRIAAEDDANTSTDHWQLDRSEDIEELIELWDSNCHNRTTVIREKR